MSGNEQQHLGARSLSSELFGKRHHPSEAHSLTARFSKASCPQHATMKLTTSFFVPLLAGTASAVSEASVYMFPRSANANAPALSPEQARLVFAQQMGISEYHSLGSPNEETLSYINEFGLSRDPSKQATRTLLIIVEGVSSQNQEPLLQAWAAAKPAFTISNPSSYKANEKLVQDLNFQAGASRGCQFQDAINPFTDKCWSSTAKALHVDLKKASVWQKDLEQAS